MLDLKKKFEMSSQDYNDYVVVFILAKRKVEVTVTVYSMRFDPTN
jgi:hypothetical protein